jgi:hypothetical protein
MGQGRNRGISTVIKNARVLLVFLPRENEAASLVSHACCRESDWKRAGEVLHEQPGVDRRSPVLLVLRAQAGQQAVEKCALDFSKAKCVGSERGETGQQVREAGRGGHCNEELYREPAPSQRFGQRDRDPSRHAPAENDDLRRQRMSLLIARDSLSVLLRPIRDRERRPGLLERRCAERVCQRKRRKARLLQPVEQEIGGPAFRVTIGDAGENAPTRYEDDERRALAAALEPNQRRIAGCDLDCFVWVQVSSPVAARRGSRTPFKGFCLLEVFVKCCQRANVSQIELMMLVP